MKLLTMSECKTMKNEEDVIEEITDRVGAEMNAVMGEFFSPTYTKDVMWNQAVYNVQATVAKEIKRLFKKNMKRRK